MITLTDGLQISAVNIPQTPASSSLYLKGCPHQTDVKDSMVQWLYILNMKTGHMI